MPSSLLPEQTGCIIFINTGCSGSGDGDHLARCLLKLQVQISRETAPSLTSEVSLGCLGMQTGWWAPGTQPFPPARLHTWQVTSPPSLFKQILSGMLVSLSVLPHPAHLWRLASCTRENLAFWKEDGASWGPEVRCQSSADVVRTEGKDRRSERKGTFQVAAPLCVPVPAVHIPRDPTALPVFSKAGGPTGW